MMWALFSVHISVARAGPSMFFISPPVISQTLRCVSNEPHPAEKSVAVVPIAAVKLLKYSFIHFF